MISNVLTVATLAGAAMAACPLSVQIVGADNHVAQVSVTNTGAEPITVFKGNTVLSEHATKDLVVTDACKQSPRSPLSLAMSQRIMADMSYSRQGASLRGLLRQLQA